MQQETLDRLENVVDLLKQGDVNVTMGEDPHHKAYQRRSKSGKPEQIKQKGVIPAKGEQLKKPEKGGKQEAGAVLGGEEHGAFKEMLTSYFNNQKEMRDLTTRINSLKVESEEVMKNIRPLLTKFDNLDKAEDKYRVEFNEGDWDYKFLSFTRETKSYKDLYTKAFGMLNDLQRKEMSAAEEALKTITAQEKFEREGTEKAMRYSTLIKSYVGKPLTEEIMDEFNKNLQIMMSLNKALMAGGTPAGTSGVGVNKRSTDEDNEEDDKKKKKKGKAKPPKGESSKLLAEKDDEREDKKEDKGKEFKDEKGEPEKPEKKDKDSKDHEKFINKLEDGEEEDEGPNVKDKKDEGKAGEGEKAGGDEKGKTGKNGKAYEKLAQSLENLIALKQRGVKLMRHMFERKDAHGYNEDEKRPKNSEAAKKDKEEQEEKTKSLIETAMPIVAMRFGDMLEKAKSHKYIKRTGAPKAYKYTYKWGGASVDERKRMLRDVGVTVHEGLTNKEWDHLPDDIQNRLWGKRQESEHKPVGLVGNKTFKMERDPAAEGERAARQENYERLDAEKGPKFDFGKMKKLIAADAFLEHQFNRMPGSDEHKAQVLFNSEVVGDSVMIRAYEGKPEKTRLTADVLPKTFRMEGGTGKFYHGRPVYDIRAIDKKNFNPMVHNLMDQGRLKGYVQIYTDVVGGRTWVNVKESDLTQGGKTFKMEGRFRAGARALAIKQHESRIPVELREEEVVKPTILGHDPARDHIVRQRQPEEYAGLKTAIRNKDWNEAYKIVKEKGKTFKMEGETVKVEGVKLPGFIDPEHKEGIVNRFNMGVHAPYVHTQVSTLGGKERASAIVTLSLQKKEDWGNNILQNSPYMMFHIGYDGKMEQFSGIHEGPDKKKFRKTTVKSIDDAIGKINKYINQQPAYPSSKTFKMEGEEKDDWPEEYTYSKYEIKSVGSGPNVDGWVVQGKKDGKWHDIREFSNERAAEKYQDKLEAGPVRPKT